MAAYDGILNGAQPSYFLYLTVPPNTIDINIHPTKQVKFDDEHALYAILRASIKHSLGQFNVAPILDFDRDSNLDTPYHYKDLEVLHPTIQVDGNFNPFRMIKSTNTIQGIRSRNQQQMGKLVCWIKTRFRIVERMLIFRSKARGDWFFLFNDGSRANGSQCLPNS
jgi:hypothetical protein